MLKRILQKLLFYTDISSGEFDIICLNDISFKSKTLIKRINNIFIILFNFLKKRLSKY